jgi:Zn finger protein HypA/HybF involved in hydrogenase expression
MTYQELLKSPHWQRKRLEIMQRDDFTCQYCGDKETTLNIHHLLYLPNSEPWQYESDCLITVCENCHSDEERLKDADQFLINKLCLTGLSRHQLHVLSISLFRYLRSKSDKHLRFMNLLTLLNNE